MELYIYDPVSEDRLKLILELLKLINYPECGTQSLYIYNSLINQELKYTSYQYEVHDYKEKIQGPFKFIGDLIDY